MRRIAVALFLAYTLVQCHSEKKENGSAAKLQQNSITLTQKDTAFYIQEGTQLAKKMYFEILSRLNKALDEKGPYEAVHYCNLNALPMTDSLAKYYGITAKRTSLKLRNPANAPDTLEKRILEMYAQTQSKKPVVVAMKDSVKFFTPIFIAKICLNCHGVPNQDIPDVTMIALNKWYPHDQAKNYELYDIRGMWSITFPLHYQSKLNSTH